MSMALQQLRHHLLVVAVVVASVVTPGECIVDQSLPNIFYPFGDDVGDTIEPIRDDGYTGPINIPVAFPFYGSNSYTLNVDPNGAFTFDNAYGTSTPTPFPIWGTERVALYWSDVDLTRNNGRLYYRSSTNPTLLKKASADVLANNMTQCLGTFNASWIFIATWHNVTHYSGSRPVSTAAPLGGSTDTEINSFQGILVTNGTLSFAIFNYGNLTWKTGTTGRKDGESKKILAQVGFDAGDGITYYAVPASRTNGIIDIYKQSNVGITGRWIFRIDPHYIGSTASCEPDQTAVCWCVGDPHCSTFDGLFPINYQGTCEYLLAGVVSSPSRNVIAFQVYVQNDHYFSPANTAVSYVAHVRLVFFGMEIKLERDFTVPWIPVKLSVHRFIQTIPYIDHWFRVFHVGLSARIELRNGVTVDYDGYTTVSVSVPPIYSNQLTGLCGNYDGNLLNDWTTANGTYVGDKTNKTNLLGDSYVVGSTFGCSESAPPDPNPSNCAEYTDMNNLCTNSILISADCMAVMGNDATQQFIDACVLDACLANSKLSACYVVSKFFEACSRNGTVVSCSDWQSAGCGAIYGSSTTGRCPSGMTYQCDAPACTATCENPTPKEGCTLPNREGCVCPAGHLQFNGLCYVTCPVGCFVDGVLREVNSEWIDPTSCATLFCSDYHDDIFRGVDEYTFCDGACVNGTCFVGCMSDGVLHKIDSTWTDPTSCATWTCKYFHDVYAFYQACEGDCVNGTCFVGCMIDGVLRKVGSTWTDPASCATWKCVWFAEFEYWDRSVFAEYQECNGDCVNGTCFVGCKIDGVFHEIGAQWRGIGCNTSTCQACTNCSSGVEVVETTCRPGEICNRDQCVQGGSKLTQKQIAECLRIRKRSIKASSLRKCKSKKRGRSLKKLCIRLRKIQKKQRFCARNGHGRRRG